MPLGPWRSDPRSQLFLVDALDYLASPGRAAPPPSRRPAPIELVPAGRCLLSFFPKIRMKRSLIPTLLTVLAVAGGVVAARAADPAKHDAAKADRPRPP